MINLERKKIFDGSTSKITVIVSVVAVCFVFLSLLLSFVQIKHIFSVWQIQQEDNVKHAQLKYALKPMLEHLSFLEQIERYHQSPTPLGKQFLQQQLSGAKSALETIQKMPHLSEKEGHSLVKINAALDSLAQVFYSTSQSYDGDEEAFKDNLKNLGEVELNKLLALLHSQTLNRTSEISDKIDSISNWLPLSLFTTPFLLLIIFRFKALSNELEQAKLSKESQMDSIFDLSPEPTVVLDYAGNIVFANQQASIFCNCPALQLTQMHFDQFIDKDRNLEQLKGLIAGNIKKPYVKLKTNFSPMNSDSIEVKIKLSPYQLDDTHHVIVTLNNVERKRKLHQSIQLKQHMFDCAEQLNHSGSWYWEIANDQLTWSAQVYELFGYSEHELDINNESWLKWVAEKERASVESTLKQASIDGQSFTVIFSAKKHNGSDGLFELVAKATCV